MPLQHRCKENNILHEVALKRGTEIAAGLWAFEQHLGAAKEEL